MSKLLRLPFALLAVLALFLLSPGIAAADGTTDPAAPDCTTEALEGCSDVLGGDLLDEPDQPGDVVDPPDELPSAPPGDDGADAQSPGVTDGLAAGTGDPEADDNTPGEADDKSDDESTGAEEGTGTPEDDESGEPDPEAVGGCIGDVLEGLVTDLQDRFGEDADELIAAIEDGLTGLDPTDPEALPTFLKGLPADAQDLLAGAADDIQACLPEQPAEGNPPPTGNPPVQPPTEPAGQDTYYANCAEARAAGAAPISSGQPGYRPELDRDSDGIACEHDRKHAVTPTSTQTTAKLAYTGVDLGGPLRLGAILIAGGTLILLAGLRRRS